jgi:RecB family endonuclease NucS
VTPTSAANIIRSSRPVFGSITVSEGIVLRVDRQKRTLRRLGERAITDAGYRERDDLQRMIRSSPDAFFDEMGEKLLLVGEEVRPADFVDDRIDLLALDQNGAAVIIELKRSSNKLQLLQAL